MCNESVGKLLTKSDQYVYLTMPKDMNDVKDTNSDATTKPVFEVRLSCCEVYSALMAYRFVQESALSLEMPQPATIEDVSSIMRVMACPLPDRIVIY